MKAMKSLIWKSTRSKLFLLLYLLTSISAGFLLIYANDLLAGLLNNYLMVQQFDGFARSMLLTAGAFVLILGLNMLEAYLGSDLEWEIIIQLKSYYLAKLLRVKQEFFKERPATEIFDNLQMATEGQGEFFGALLSLASRTIIFIFYGVVVFRLDMWAGFFTTLVLPIYFLLTVGLGNKLADLEGEYMERSGELVTVAQEALENVGNVKAKGAYNFFADRSSKLLEKAKKIVVNIYVFEHYMEKITGLFQIVAPILIIFGALQVSPTFDENAGSIMVLFINIPLFLGGFASIHKSYVHYQVLKPFYEKLQEFDDAPLEETSGMELTAFESLKTVGVSVTFDGRRTVNVPDFSVVAGEKIMFFGESGVGKSTVFNIIMGFIPTYEGDIYVNGTNLRDISLSSLRRIFGITFQQTNALTLDLPSNILLGAEKNEEELERLIKLTELELQKEAKEGTVLNNKVLSGGERSRLGLSQMMAAAPEVLLIDESFSNLDEEQETKILGNLLREAPDSTVICISHRNASRPFFDKVVDFNF